MYLFQPERYLLQKQVKKASPHIRGRVLDVGSGTFARYKRLFQFSEYVTMDIQESERVDVVGSADQIPFPDNSFDSLISTQVLGDIMDPQKAVSEFHRVLKKGGTAVITESFINEMHDEPYDYWRFTRYGFELLFKENGFTVIDIDQRGGYFSSRAQEVIRYLIDRFTLYRRPWGRIMNPLFTAYGRWMIFLDSIDTGSANRKHALGWCVIARKDR